MKFNQKGFYGLLQLRGLLDMHVISFFNLLVCFVSLSSLV